MSKVVKMADLVTLELEPRAVRRQSGDRVLDILEGIAEDQVACALKIQPLPSMLERLEAVQHGEQSEIHRSHVQRGKFRLETD
jgi:hypothetical protein